MIEIPKSNYLSVRETAGFLNLSESTIRSYLVKGIAPVHYRVNRKILFDQKDLILWMNEKRIA